MGSKGRRVSGRRGISSAALAVAVLVLAVLVPAAAESTVTSAVNNGLSAYVLGTNRGPIAACSGADCTPANTAWFFIHVVNSNSLTNDNGGTSRATVPNSFVVGDVEMTVSVDGAVYSDTTFTPPPNITPDFLRAYAGHWPATVTCGGDPPPCAVVVNPAVLPTENTIADYIGWTHGTDEPNGTYVFRFTVHGTLNGEPAEVSATSQKISMTG